MNLRLTKKNCWPLDFFANSGLTNSVLTEVAGDFVFAQDINTLYLDYDGNGSLNGNDFQLTDENSDNVNGILITKPIRNIHFIKVIMLYLIIKGLIITR